MKHILFLIFSAIGLGVYAQNPADEVIDKFVKQSEVSRFFRRVSKSENSEGQHLMSHFEQSDFKMPESNRLQLEQMLQQLRSLQSQAYKFVERAKGNDAITNIISIDNWPNKSVSDSPEDNSILLCFRSPADSLRRYANLLTWREMHDSIRGTIYRVYGLDPARKKEGRTMSTLNILGQDFDLGSISLLDLGSSRIVSDGNRRWIEFGGKQANKDADKDAKPKTMPEVGDTATIANSTDLIREFTRLYTLFVSVQGSWRETGPFQNTILTRMDNLVRQHGAKFQMKEECDLCVKMLKAMKKDVRALNREPMRGYIDIIIKRTKNAKKKVTG